MNTRDIIVSPINDNEFGDIHAGWYVKRGKDRKKGLLKIENPLRAPNYALLISEFMKHPQAGKISVNCKGTWVKQKRSEWNDKTLPYVVQTAENDSVKRGHLELFLGDGSPEQSLRLKFVETSNGIIAYEIVIPSKYKPEVTWRGGPLIERPSFIGLWNRPEEYKLVGSFQG